MRIFIHWDDKDDEDLSRLVTACTWSGSRIQVPRQLSFTITQDDRDKLVPVVKIENGYTIHGYNDEDMENPVFVGNVYKVVRNRQRSSVSVLAKDHLFVMTRSQMTREFNSLLPEDIAQAMCKTFGVIPGTFAQTGIPVTFIANNKTGYQVIMAAYNEAAKKNEKKYQPIMNGAKLDVIEKGALIEGFVADASKNMTESEYSESIEKLIDQVMVVDEKGNLIEYIKNDEHIANYSTFQAVYKSDPNKDTQTEAKKLLTKPDRTGTITVLGDYRVKSSYSIEIKDSLFDGKFWVKSDTHTFTDGKHEMRLELEFENIMNEEKAEKKKEKKEKAEKKRRKSEGA